MPSEFREPKDLPEWIELDYHRRPRGLVRWLRRLTWAALLLTIVGVGVAVALPRSARLVQAGPVTEPHAAFNGDCARCHTGPAPTAWRFLPGSSQVHAVTNEACSSCHDGPKHNAFVPAGQSCAGCHREHRGKPLTRVPDGQCLACHADLKAHHREPERCPYQNVGGFPTGHPEMRLWRGADPDVPLDPKTEAPVDPGKLFFNHQKHLAEGGVLTPEGGRTRLACADCHRLDDAGKLMQPISYERDCRRCHQLWVRLAGNFADPELDRVAEQFAREPAPHREPRVVRAALRERLVEIARQTPLTADPPEADPRVPKRLPPLTEPQWQRVKRVLTASEEVLFLNQQLPEVERPPFNLSGGCSYCHIEKGRSGDGLPEYAPTNLHASWLTHARFDHKAHRMVACTECHAAATSARTSDVLLPKLETCAKCHNPQAGVRSDCVACHQYHPRGGTEEHPRKTIAECLGR